MNRRAFVARARLLSRCALSALVLIGVGLASSRVTAQQQGRPYRIGVLKRSPAIFGGKKK
jgi:hypothetical protein